MRACDVRYYNQHHRDMVVAVAADDNVVVDAIADTNGYAKLAY